LILSFTVNLTVNAKINLTVNAKIKTKDLQNRTYFQLLTTETTPHNAINVLTT